MSVLALPDLGDEVMFPRLSDEKIARLAESGERRSFATDEPLYEQGERDTPFYVIEDGLVHLVDHRPGELLLRPAQGVGRTSSSRRRTAGRSSATSRFSPASRPSRPASLRCPPM